MTYNEILEYVTNIENTLLTKHLSSVEFETLFYEVLSLRKSYTLDNDGKYVETSQFLNYLKTLIIKKEKYMSNTTFNTVIKQLFILHKEFNESNSKRIFIDREIEYIKEIKNCMLKDCHLMTTYRLNYMYSLNQTLKKELSNISLDSSL